MSTAAAAAPAARPHLAAGRAGQPGPEQTQHREARRDPLGRDEEHEVLDEQGMPCPAVAGDHDGDDLAADLDRQGGHDADRARPAPRSRGWGVHPFAPFVRPAGPHSRSDPVRAEKAQGQSRPDTTKARATSDAVGPKKTRTVAAQRI